MNRRHDSSESDNDVQDELDRFVIEVIDTLIATSRNVRSKRSEQHAPKPPAQPVVQRSGTVTPLKGRGRVVTDLNEHVEPDDGEFDAGDDVFAEGLSAGQRDRAEAFAAWLMQQDNYPVVLQHVEELLAPLGSTAEWDIDSDDPASAERAADAGSDVLLLDVTPPRPAIDDSTAQHDGGVSSEEVGDES